MNAALMMLTSAWMAGADAVPAAPAPVPQHGQPVIVQAPANSSCGGCATACDSCCDRGRRGLFGRLRAWINRRGSDCCENNCKPAKVEHCKPAPSCDSGCDSGRGGLFSRLRHRSRKSDCCESTCDPCHSTVVPAPAVLPTKPQEPVKDAPKKMPDKVSAPEIPLVPTANPKPIIGVVGPGSPF